MKHDKNESTALTRARLSQAIQEHYGSALDVPKQRYLEVVDGFFDEICTTLVQGENLKITSFGSFIIKQKTERLGRNPKTGEDAKITQRKVITFKPSHHLKSRIHSKKG